MLTKELANLLEDIAVGAQAAASYDENKAALEGKLAELKDEVAHLEAANKRMAEAVLAAEDQSQKLRQEADEYKVKAAAYADEQQKVIIAKAKEDAATLVSNASHQADAAILERDEALKTLQETKSQIVAAQAQRDEILSAIKQLQTQFGLKVA